MRAGVHRMTPAPTISHSAPRVRRGPRSVRGRLLAGALIIIPIAITGWLVSVVYGAALWAGKPLVHWFIRGMQLVFNLDEPQRLGPAENVVAVLLTLVMLYVLGVLGSNVVGRRLIALAESLLERIPFVDTIYTSTKRMLQSLTGPPGAADGSGQVVVLIDFPTPPLKVIAFMTNTITDRNTGQRYATVFVPTTPNPTSGYMELVPIESVQATDWTMEQALTTILSGGASSPNVVTLRALGVHSEHPGPAARVS